MEFNISSLRSHGDDYENTHNSRVEKHALSEIILLNACTFPTSFKYIANSFKTL